MHRCVAPELGAVAHTPIVPEDGIKGFLRVKIVPNLLSDERASRRSAFCQNQIRKDWCRTDIKIPVHRDVWHNKGQICGHTGWQQYASVF